MNEKEKEIREYFIEALGKKIHSLYIKKDKIFGDIYFFNDAYVLKIYDNVDVDLFSLDRMKNVYELIEEEKISEKVLYIDDNKRIKITKIVHGDISYNEYPINNVQLLAKSLKKLHRHVSTNDIAMDVVEDLYRFKEHSENKINKILENRIVRELNNFKDKTPVGLCHNYLTKDNLIFRYNSSFIINYELANINYIYFDLASFIHENDISDELKTAFLKTYFGASYNELKAKRIKIFENFYSLYYYYYYQYLFSVTKQEFYLHLMEKEKKYLENL